MTAVGMNLNAPAKQMNGHKMFSEEVTIAEFSKRVEVCKTEEEARALILDTLASLGYSGSLAVLWTKFPLFKKNED